MFRNFKKNDKYLTIAIYAFLVIAASIGLICVLLNFSTIASWIGSAISAMSSFIYAFIFAYLCNALYKKFHKYVFKFVERKKAHPKLRKFLSITLTYIVFIAVVCLFVWAIVPGLVSSIDSLISNVNDIIDNLTDAIRTFLQPFGFIDVDTVVSQVTEFFSKDNEAGALTIALRFIRDNLGVIGTASASVLMDICVGLILSVYLLIYKEKMIAKLKKFLCAIFSENKYKGIVNFGRFSDRIFGRYMLGTIVDSFFVGLLMFLVLWIFQFPYPALIAVTCGVTNIIPFFGPFIGAIPSGLLILISPVESGGGIFRVIIFVIIVFVLQQIDGNIIAPQIHGAATGMTPIGVIAAVTFASHAFGFIGMVIGVPIFAIVFYYITKIINKRLKKKHLPVQSDYYRVSDVYEDENFNKARNALEAEEEIDKSETLATATIKDEIIKEIKEQVVEKVLNEALEGINETADEEQKEING